MAEIDESLLNEKAELLKALAHPTRLCIAMRLLDESSCNVSNMQSCLKMPQSTVSQHLAKLRNAGIISGERDGVEINYSVVNEEVKELLAVLFN
ncbi:MAG: ArsR/SmtB family transcription factor [Bacillota bacterium]